MNRFATRLLAAILGVAVLSLMAIPLAGVVALERTFGDLPEPFRERVLERSTPPGPLDVLTGLWPGVLPFTPPAAPPPPRDDFGTYRLGVAGVTPFEPMVGPITLPVLADPVAVDVSAEAARLDAENARLFALVGEMRAALRVAAAVGAGVALTVAALLALVLARTIARPLEMVSGAAARLAEGDLGARVLPAFEAAPQGLGAARWRRSAEMVELARGFDAMAAALETAERDRRAMIADIAHDLRTPLATLQMRLDALQAGLVPLERSEIDLLQEQVGHLGRLVGDLRLLSLADAGQLSLEPVPTELNAWLERRLEGHRPAAARRGVRLDFEPGPAPLWARVDPDRFERILANLLSNALRAASERPDGERWVRIEAVPAEGDRVALRVLDSGPGIPPAVLPRVFERFVRGRHGRRDLTGGAGSGLGLAIVRTLAELHGGSVSAENRAHGACLSVIVPAAPTPSGDVGIVDPVRRALVGTERAARERE